MSSRSIAAIAVCAGLVCGACTTTNRDGRGSPGSGDDVRACHKGFLSGWFVAPLRVIVTAMGQTVRRRACRPPLPTPGASVDPPCRGDGEEVENTYAAF